jgi:LysM repeat protein
MKQLLFIVSLMCAATAIAQPTTQPVEYSNDARIRYIRDFRIMAQRDMQINGIPASIKLGQAILESNAGQSTLAREANNHFGIKCHRDWNGKTYEKEDDDRDANGNLIKSCFRKYKHVDDCYEDHSKFLRDPKKYYRYGFLFDLDRRDYRSWAYGLQSAGYATSQTYAESLIRIIEEYKLHEYDTPSANDPIVTAPDVPVSGTGGGRTGGRTGGHTESSALRTIGRVNDVKAVRASSGQSIQAIARRYGLSPNKVACYNDCQIAVTQELTESDIVYLSKKRKKWRGRTKEHFVQRDETMFSIAQRYGIQLMSLYTLNNMQGGTEPVLGERIKLKGRKRKDAVKIRTDIPVKQPVVTQPTRPGVPTSGANPTTQPTTPDPSPYKPTNTELFEMGEGGVTQPNTPKPNQPAPGRPATTGTSRPDAPVIPPNSPTTTTGTSSNNNPNTQPNNPSKPETDGGFKPTPAGFHTVIKGDTLYNISKRYGLTVDQLRALNNLPNNDIKIGQLIKVK